MKSQQIKQQNESSTKIPLNLKILRFINGDSTKNSISKVKASLFAIIIGLLLGIIPIVIAGGSPFYGYWLMISGPFTAAAVRRTMVIISVFIILGAGIGVSFRTGLFNIGATGQFLMAGMICVLIGINGTFNSFMSKPGALTILFIVALIVGALMAAIPAILKAFFNVHEVVTTILLNWVVLYLVRWIVSLPGIVSGDGTSTLPVGSSSGFSLSTSSFDYIYIFIITLVMVSMLYIVFKYTNFGYRLRLNGLSASVAKYSGINTKVNIIYSMMISGAFAGVAGFFFYSSVERVVPLLDTLPTIGFEAITVTLLAFSSPLGSILSGFFYGLLYQGQNFMQVGAGGNVVRETAALSLGIIIFMSALAATFVEWRPIQWLNNQHRIWQSIKIKFIKNKWKQEKAQTIIQYNQLIDETKKSNDKKMIRLRNLKTEWANEIMKVNNSYQKGKIYILEKDEQINLINHHYLEIIDQEKLNEYLDAIKNKKIVLKEIDKKYRFIIEKELIDFQDQLQNLRKEKRQEINYIVTKSLTKDQKHQSISKVNHQYHNQKTKLIIAWKGVK